MKPTQGIETTITLNDYEMDSISSLVSNEQTKYGMYEYYMRRGFRYYFRSKTYKFSMVIISNTNPFEGVKYGTVLELKLTVTD